MASLHRDPGGGRADAYRIVTEDLVGLVDHLHLLLGVAVLKEIINMGNDILVNRIVVEGGILSPFAPIPFRHHLVDSGSPGAGDALIRGDHDPLDGILLMEGRQWKKHLDGGAIRVGDDIIIFRKDISVDLGNDQFLGRIHSPAGGIVHHAASDLGELRRPLLGDVGSG